jgi:glucoamylase
MFPPIMEHRCAEASGTDRLLVPRREPGEEKSMPRDLPVGNGQMLANFDSCYFLRDFYFPHVGQENQTLGHPSRFGVWVDGCFAWLDAPGWERRLDYLPDTLVTDVRLRHPGLGLELECHDAVDFHLPVYVKQVIVRNQSDREREVRLFFHHDFHLYEVGIGDTAYYEPVNDVLIHYRARRYLAIRALPADSSSGFYQFATGIKELPGKEGTWRDAEDGELGGNAITQGSVDLTFSMRRSIPPGESATFCYWISAGHDYWSVRDLTRAVAAEHPECLLHRTANYWRSWVHGADRLEGLTDAHRDLFRRSLLIVHTQIDNGGAILAANDGDTIVQYPDTYSYMWPRDGALVAAALDDAGFPEVTRRFFRFCKQLMPPTSYYPPGYLLHKYNPDGSLGSSWHPWLKGGRPQLPIQEDETALVLWALGRHYHRYRDLQFVSEIYEPLVKPAARFLCQYREPHTGLPKESFDLWEERYGIFTFTTCAVIAGLKAAAEFAGIFGEEELVQEYHAAADGFRAAMERHLYAEDLGRFLRMVEVNADTGEITRDLTVDSSLCALFLLDTFSPDDPRVAGTVNAVRDCLAVRTPVGGISRYQSDTFQRIGDEWERVPGNPWYICTLWLADWLIGVATRTEDLEPARAILDWAAGHTLPSGVMAEQLNPYTGAHVSVAPLTWSHATYIQTALRFSRAWQRLAPRPSNGNSPDSAASADGRGFAGAARRLDAGAPRTATDS